MTETRLPTVCGLRSAPARTHVAHRTPVPIYHARAAHLPFDAARCLRFCSVPRILPHGRATGFERGDLPVHY